MPGSSTRTSWRGSAARRLEDGVLREMGVTEGGFDIGVAEKIGDDPQTLAGAHRDRRMAVPLMPFQE